MTLLFTLICKKDVYIQEPNGQNPSVVNPVSIPTRFYFGGECFGVFHVTQVALPAGGATAHRRVHQVLTGLTESSFMR